MKDQLHKKLIKKYPNIFLKKEPKLTPYDFYDIECEDGWYDLIDHLCDKLTHLSNVFNCHIIAGQVKEKFGGLRFYVDIEYPIVISKEDKKKQWEIIQDVIGSHEEKSFHICEFCGTQIYVGKVVLHKRLIKTLCKKCAVIESL